MREPEKLGRADAAPGAFRHGMWRGGGGRACIFSRFPVPLGQDTPLEHPGGPVRGPLPFLSYDGDT